MKIKLLSIVLALLVALPLMAAPRLDQSRNAAPSAMQIDNETFIDANRILMFVTNHGNFGRDLSDYFGNDYGTYWPFTSVDDIFSGANVRSPLYAGGLWIGGTDVDTGDTLVIISEYSDEYVPGPMLDSTFMPDVPEFRVYKLFSDSLRDNPNQDYTDYLLHAVAQGAPTKLDDSGNVVPDMLGDQMLWSVFNDANPAQHNNSSGETDPLGLEVKSTAFAFNRENPLGNIVFMRFQVFNKGTRTLENLFFSIWNDPDLGGAGDDLVGCDTALSLGYCYNANNADQYYGATPPAYGVDFFQGPLEFTGDPADTAKMWGQLWPEYRNLAMSSFNKYINGTDPDNYQETYYYMNGLNRDGSDYQYNGVVSKFVHTGDPVAGTGDLDVAPADRRFMMSTGPVTFAPGDSTEILCALIVGQGGDRLSSIAVLKYYDQFAQSAYDIDFDIPEAPASPVVRTKELDRRIVLYWGDDSEVNSGDYPFQGYTVYQGSSPNGPWTQIANYDVTDGIAQIQDAVLDPLTGSLEMRLVKNGNDGGLKRYFVVDQDYLRGGKLNNVSLYYFRVEAYSYDPDATPITLTSANRTPINVRPQAPTPNMDYSVTALDTLPVTKLSGLSDGVVYPLVVDPSVTTGDTYEITFGLDTSVVTTSEWVIDSCAWDTIAVIYDTTVVGDTTIIVAHYVTDTLYCDSTEEVHVEEVVRTFWNMRNVTTNTMVIERNFNQEGDEDYQITDGLVVKVSGPPAPGIKEDDMFSSNDPSTWGWDIPQGTRRLTWAAADGFHFEGFRGAAGWAGVGDLFGGPNVRVDAAELVSVVLRLATVDTDGTFDPADVNVSYAYRYGRGFTAPAAQPEFVPYMVNTVGGGYSFQDFERSCPLSAWNVDAEPPVRLKVGYLENNATYAVLDGKYWPRESDEFADFPAEDAVSNTSGNGPREWLFIFKDEYSETADPTYQGDLLSISVPSLYFLTVNRRGSDVPFSPGGTGDDEFLLSPNKINTPGDVFRFTAPAAGYASSGSEADLNAIKAVPNPFYLYGPYDPSPGNKQIYWHHLPERCTITIYNLSGELIRTLDKNDASALAYWDLLTQRGLPVASGIYIWVVDAPGFGQKIGKMAIFMEQEVLQIY